MGKPKDKSPDDRTMVSMRFEKMLLEKIDLFIKHFEKENKGLKISRADAIRMLVTKGLEKGEALV